MSPLLWAVLAILAGLGAVTLRARAALRLPPPLDLPPGESLAPTFLQRLARRTVLAGLALIGVAAVAVLLAGAETFYRDDTIRIGITVLMLAALLVLAWFGMRVGALANRPGGPLDERDIAILERAPRLEGGAMLVTLALWVVGMGQAFWEAGAVPIAWLYLMFWSILLLKALVLPLGVLLGYRRN